MYTVDLGLYNIIYTYTMCIGPGQSSRTNIHPHLISERELSVLMSKSHLIIRSIQLKIGHDLLMQVYWRERVAWIGDAGIVEG